MNASQLAEQILAFWQQTDAFRQSIQQKSEKMTYTFYDGPPFTSGDPHYGHLLQSIVKDIVPRRMSMRGYRVERRRGRDCHGIPAENFVNKQLGISSKKQVEEEFGLKNYIEACRSMVNNVNENWKWTIDNIGRWVDMENAYFTMDNDFMESVICLFADLYHRNLIYKGFKVLGYSRALGTALSNSEIAEGYEMRQDPAVTVKLPLFNQPSHAYQTAPDDHAIEVVAGVIRDETGRLLMIYENKHNARYFPGGKIEIGEAPVDALKREIQEELGVEVTSEQFLGQVKTVHKAKLYRLHYFAITIAGTPIIQEPLNHGMVEWIEKVPSENSFGYVLKFANLIITDPMQLRHEFADIHMLEQGLVGQEKAGSASVCILPWTTTPRTLPANMFAAIHRDLEYTQVFDRTTHEYYIIATACLSKYYKSPDEYREVETCKGEELVGMVYKPLYTYYHDAPYFAADYKARVHHILHADFVTVESGTGIVHEAPAFGADDYDLVASVLGKDSAQQWLFDPVDEYGEFTEVVSDFAGINVFEANALIIKDLKHRNLLIKQETINHSYPHCPRTKTPLIYKAIESRFVKEEDLKAQTVPAAEDISFVPETVKQRFINGLMSAPDRNISRTRYRGAPLPVWISEDTNDAPLVLGSREEIFQYAKTGSNNITKFVFVRHGQTGHNAQTTDQRTSWDVFGEAVLTDLGKQQAIALSNAFTDQGIEPDVIIISPFQRTFFTAEPFLQQRLGDDFAGVKERYLTLSEEFRNILKTEGFETFFAQQDREWIVRLHDRVYMDYRIVELMSPASNEGKVLRVDTPGEYFPTRSDRPATPDGESMFTLFARGQQAIQDLGERFVGKTVVLMTHSAIMRMLRMAIEPYDFDLLWQDKVRRRNFNALPEIHYYDTHIQKGMDLHRPYIDDIWFTHEGKKRTRIPEVLDCWFESGSMPYGQMHFMKPTPGKGPTDFHYCANFIAEGLDQTRGWFRALHVLGHAYHGQNVFQNVVVTGMILAEDGKKMSKSLKNYPDPSHLITQYGADALRLYLLGSPVVRAEPLRFSEKGVDQLLKDVVIPLQNVANFFKMYAQVDTWRDQGTQVWFMRHALKENDGQSGGDEGEIEVDKQIPLSSAGVDQLASPEFIEQVLRIDPEVILCSEFLRAQQTAAGVMEVMETYTGKKPELVITDRVGLGMKAQPLDPTEVRIEATVTADAQGAGEVYTNILEQYKGKRVLIVSHKKRFRYLRQRLFGLPGDMNTFAALQSYFPKSAVAIPLPTMQVINELDQWVLAELHRTIAHVDQALRNNYLEEATNELSGFVDSLTNWYLRRSRRRFWSEEMTEDKQQAYQTLFTVLTTYLQLAAPFIPFVTESLWQELHEFTDRGAVHPSVHLQAWPIAAQMYINEQLLEEIATVRKIIKGALYLRAKHQVKIKQPLPSLAFRI